MVLVVREVVVRPAQRSSRASHSRQRREMEVRDRVCAVGSLERPSRRTGGYVAMRLKRGLVCL